MTMPSELPMPCCGAIFPLPVHAIDASKHTWEPPGFTHLHKSCSVLCIWCSQVSLPKDFNHCFHKLLQTQNNGAFCNMKPIIKRISRDTISEHAQCCSNLLKRTMSKVPRSIPCLLEVWTMSLHSGCNSQE
ncbi:hypothetical protein PVAP13_6NG192303 [Panicum virgatum]|uniref:Uncharacterized protein n=1 Tax=Panicum virgatum TaxID=38727 RepID=A0A8T0QXA6_PANVG|nr:hypothetical protein PVAP13_6NG192303 [Panicum virgatum]